MKYLILFLFVSCGNQPKIEYTSNHPSVLITCVHCDDSLVGEHKEQGVKILQGNFPPYDSSYHYTEHHSTIDIEYGCDGRITMSTGGTGKIIHDSCNFEVMAESAGGYRVYNPEIVTDHELEKKVGVGGDPAWYDSTKWDYDTINFEMHKRNGPKTDLTGSNSGTVNANIAKCYDSILLTICTYPSSEEWFKYEVPCPPADTTAPVMVIWKDGKTKVKYPQDTVAWVPYYYKSKK